MRRRHPERAHLVQHHMMATLGELPGSLGAREAAADDVDGGHPASACSSVGATSHSLPHLMHLRYSPRALVNFISAPS
jgi:hypothetical protein